MVSDYIKKLLKDKARLKKWKRITLALSCVVVFCVVYALTLPAITLEGKTICGMEEHTHTEECYQDDELVCGKEEHQHTEDCYEKEEEQPVEDEENTQPETTESSDEVETVAESEESKQDESNEDEQQQESTQVTSEGFDLSANQNNIESVDVLYQLNGEWQTVHDGLVSPDSTDIQIKVKYKEISTKDLHEKYNNTLIYNVPEFLRDAHPKGNLYDNGEVVGTITVENGRAYLRFHETYLKKLIALDNNTLKGDFNIEGNMDLSHLDQNNGTATLTTANKTIYLNFGQDVIQKFGDVFVDKQYSKDGKEKNGDYIKYTVTVTAGIDGCKNITVVDKFTQNNNLVSYVGMSQTEKILTDSAVQYNPFEKIENNNSASHGKVYLSVEKNGETNPIPDVKPGNLVWDIGDMAPNEKRTLTYYVKLVDKDALNGKHIDNSAVVYSKGTSEYYNKGKSEKTFIPTIDYKMPKSVVKKDNKDFIRNEDGTYTIEYKLDFKLEDTSNYSLKNFEFYDYLNHSNNATNEKILPYVTYNKDSVKLFKVNGNNTTEVDSTKYVVSWSKDKNNYETNWKDKENPTCFKVSGSKDNPIVVNPGDSYYVTYKVTVKPDALAAMHANSVEIKNRWIASADNADKNFSPGFNAYNCNAIISGYEWNKKQVGGEATKENKTIKLNDNQYVLNSNNGSINKSSVNENSFTVPEGSYLYTVDVNQTLGDWNVTEMTMKDTLNSKNMEYVGYVKVDALAYESGKYVVKETKWLKIDKLSSFSLKLKQLGWENNKYAYHFEYYAQPVNKDSYTQTLIKNKFTLEGNIVGTGFTFNENDVSSSTEIKISGSLNMTVGKSSWYYQPPVADQESFKKGELYWVINIGGTKIKEGTIFKDSIVKSDSIKASYLHTGSLVGIYKGNKAITEYSDLSEFNKGQYEDLKDRFEVNYTNDLSFEGTDNNSELILKAKEDITLNDGENVYMIIKTEPSVLPSDSRDAFEFKNSISTKDDESSSDFIEKSSANKILYSCPDILKEYGQTFTYDGENVESKNDGRDEQDSNKIAKEYLIGTGTYASWAFKLNYAGELSGSYRVLEQIPDGMQLAYIRIKWVGPNQKTQDSIESKSIPINDLGEGWAEKTITAKDDDNKSRTTKYYVKDNQAFIELGDFIAGHVRDDYSVDVQVVCKVIDPDVLLGGKSKNFKNEVTLIKDGQTINTATNSKEISIEDKKNISKTQAPSGEKVVFTIKANQLGQTLPSNDGDTLKLVDHLSSNLILNFKSIKVVNTKDSSEIKDYKASYPDNVLEIEIPNNIPLTITYEATINGPPGQNLSFSNEAYWKNYSPSGGVKVEKSDYSYTAGGSVEGTANPTLKIIKLDQDNTDVALSGAEFKMVECQLESNGIVEKENGHSWQGKTDENGELILGSDTPRMEYDTIYKVEEIESPEGYILNNKAYYVMDVKSVSGEEYSEYVKKCIEYSNTHDLTILYNKPIYELQVFNEQKGITVEKLFKDVGGNKSNPLSGNYWIGLYEKAEDNTLKQVKKKCITYTSGETTPKTVKFVNLDINKTYYVYELDGKGNQITDSNVHVINGQEYFTSYSNNEVKNGATVTVTNQSRVKQLPSTGSYGTLIYRISGAMLVLASLIVLTNINKKNHLNDKSKNRRKK